MPRRRLLAIGLSLWCSNAAADEVPLRFAGELRPGDDRCQNLCDRYGLSWARGAWVQVRIATAGFTTFLKTTLPAGVQTSVVGRQSELRFTANPGAPYFVEVNASDHHGRGQYWLEVSPPPSRFLQPPERAEPRPQTPEEQDPDTRVHDTLGRMMQGYRASTPLMVGRLDQVPQLQLPVRRGRCYRAAIVLGHGARLAPDIAVRWTVRGGESVRMGAQTERSTPRVLALDEDQCPSASGTIQIDFVNTTRGTPQPVAGAGSFTLQLFERTIASAELAQREAAQSSRVCGACGTERQRCTDVAGSCEALFERCVRAGGLDPRACRR